MPGDTIGRGMTQAEVEALEAEYAGTLRVLVVLVERLQTLSGTDTIYVDDKELVDNPTELTAWRGVGENRVTLKATR